METLEKSPAPYSKAVADTVIADTCRAMCSRADAGISSRQGIEAPSELPVRDCESERRDQQGGWPGTAAAVPGPQVHLLALSFSDHSP